MGGRGRGWLGQAEVTTRAEMDWAYLGLGTGLVVEMGMPQGETWGPKGREETVTRCWGGDLGVGGRGTGRMEMGCGRGQV